MRKQLFFIYFLLVTPLAWAQVPVKGSKVFIENNSKNENALKTAKELANKLNEWDYWSVTNKEQDADFKINLDISASKGMTLTSWGGTSYALTAKLIDKKDEVFWESNTYKSSPNGTNGYNSSKAVVRKLIRDLKKEVKEN